MNTHRINCPASRRPPFAQRTCLALALAAIALPAYSQSKRATTAASDFIPGELVIKFKAGAEDSKLRDAFQRGQLDQVKRSVKLKSGHSGLHLISTRLDVPSALRALRHHPAVDYAEPNYRIYPSVVQNDPMSQWALAPVSAQAAWDVTTGSSSVLVGVLDSGVDYTHPDLAANVWTNPGEIPGDGLDNDNNGYVDDMHGWDWWNGDNTVLDPNENPHGTHVAGIIGAVGNNGIGIAGMNWQVKIVPLKFIGPEFGSNFGAIAGIEYAASIGVKVINGSFGSNWHSQGIKDALDAAGILFVAAAGNYATNNDITPFYPASFDLSHVVSVAATNGSDGLASFSNYGAARVDLGAPGVAINSTIPGGYTDMSGTSMAAPYVTGAAALVYSLFPDFNGAKVKHRILSGVDPVAGLAGKSLTGGRLNAARALLAPAASSSIAQDGFESGSFTGGSGAWTGGWTTGGDISIRTQDGPAEGTRHVRLRRATGEMRRTVNVAGVSGLALSFKSKVSSFEGSDSAQVLVSTDGGSFTPVASFNASSPQNQYLTHEIELMTGGGVSQIQILFDAGMSAMDDNWYLDDIRITGAGGNSPPVADAGQNRWATDSDSSGSEFLTLNGGNSFDPDGSIVAYSWTVNGVEIGTTPVADVEVITGTWTATLTVTDDSGAVRSDTMQITVNGPPVVVLDESFERTSLSPWTLDNQKDWAITTQNASAGTRAAEVDGAASDAQLISPVINLQGRIWASVTFDWLIESGLDAGEYIVCDISQDGGATWIETIYRLDGNVHAEDTWHTADLGTFSTPAGTLRLRFRGKMSASDEDAFVDNLRVVAE
jgi:thermitase